jgi:Mg2+/Co2+ transporter CorB
VNTNDLASSLISSGVTVALMILGLLLVQFLDLWARRAARSAERMERERQRQLVTLVQILRSVARVLIGLTALVIALSDFDITPPLAGAGWPGWPSAWAHRRSSRTCSGACWFW